MHPHIPRPRRKATRTCTDTAGVVRTVHGEFMWPFTARVNEKTAPIERIAAVAICRRLRDARGRIYAPPSTANALLAGIAADDGTDCHSIWSERLSSAWRFPRGRVLCQDVQNRPIKGREFIFQPAAERLDLRAIAAALGTHEVVGAAGG